MDMIIKECEAESKHRMAIALPRLNDIESIAQKAAESGERQFMGVYMTIGGTVELWITPESVTLE